jgi:hypothetical protein
MRLLEMLEHLALGDCRLHLVEQPHLRQLIRGELLAAAAKELRLEPGDLFVEDSTRLASSLLSWRSCCSSARCWRASVWSFSTRARS